MAEAASQAPAPRPQAQPAPRAWSTLEGLRREIDRMFDEFPSGFLRSPFQGSPFAGKADGTAIPAVDIAEKADAYEVTAELPGMEEKDIDVSLSEGMLTIRGEKQERKEEKEKDYYLAERRYGSFQRSFPVPAGVDAGAVAANFKNGVLTVTLPKLPEAQKKPTRIAVNAK
jgi:HSP20 family protein